MRIKWYGHSCFKITDDRNVRIVTDPFDDSVGYKMPDLTSDIVTISHNHYDHNYTKMVKGDYELINKVGNFYAKDINIRGILSHHDKNGGSKRGDNIIFTFDIGGIKVCHLGDLGHLLTDKQIALIGGVDVLLIPVGGYYTIDACDAVEVIKQLKPSVIIPMHFKTPVMDMPIDNVEVFLQKIGGGEKLPSQVVEIDKNHLNGQQQVYVLRYE